jgi:UDP-N-acetylglucosamine 4-epimerase
MFKEQFSKLSSKKILVTDGDSFIGSKLCEKFIEVRESLVYQDNFATGKRENPSVIKEHLNFTLMEGDIRILETCYKVAKGVDYLFNEAALSSVPFSLNDPIATNDVVALGFINMVVADRNKIPYFKNNINV